LRTRRDLAATGDSKRHGRRPLAHGALSARLIARTGLGAFVIGRSCLLATRFGLTGLGLFGVSSMTTGIRDIAAATTLPLDA
jgi:2-methylisocitrate lyase-like PEP mutase family enzyme